MKKIPFILLLSLVALLCACSQEDDNKTLFYEPSLKFGIGKDYINLVETRNLSESNDSISTFISSNNLLDKSVSYAFRNDSLIASIVILKDNVSDKKRAKDFLEKNYVSLSYDYAHKMNFYGSKDGKTLAILSDNDYLGLNILYTPYKNVTDKDGEHSLQSLYQSRISLFYKNEANTE